MTFCLFSVKVPVLSVHIILEQPNVSTLANLFIIAFSFAILLTPIAKHTVTTVANPSGIAATANDTADLKASIKLIFKNNSNMNTIIQIKIEIRPIILPI